MVAIVAAIGLYLSFIFVDNNTTFFTRQGDYELPDSIAQAVQEPKFLYGMMINDKEVSENKIKRDQNFVDLLEGYFVHSKVIQQLNTLPRKLFDFRKVTAGSKYTIVAETDSLKSAKAIIYEASPVNYFVFHLKDTLIVESCEKEITKVEKTVAGEITSSLYETIDELGISPELTNKFVDVFGWQVDFQRLQKGDKFKLIYEEKQVEGKPYAIGDILGIYFEHIDNPYYAIPFDQGDGLDYFDKEGMSLRKALKRGDPPSLLAPLAREELWRASNHRRGRPPSLLAPLAEALPPPLRLRRTSRRARPRANLFLHLAMQKT